MPFTVTMPKLTPTMEAGTIVKWHKQEGDEVKDGELLFEVATDKATVEYNALDGGFLRKVLISENGDAVVNQPVAVMTETADESIEGYAPEGIVEASAPSAEVETSSNDVASPQPTKTSSTMQTVDFVPEAPLTDYTYEWDVKDTVKASPYAKKVAKDKNLDLHTVKGSGPGGRVLARDLDMAQEGAVTTFGHREVPSEAPGSFIEEKLTPMRKAIGSKLQASKMFIPHFYVQQEVDMTPCMETRAQLKNSGIKVTFNDFVLRAVALALKEHPVINSGYNSAEEKIIRFKTIDISVAVSIDDGLITPIIRHADFKNLGQLSKEVKQLASLAKAGKLEEHQYKGGSFTISNLGMFGIRDFQGVINPPQAAILSVGGIVQKPVVKDGALVVGNVMALSLSSDHRVIDGADAAAFINTVKKYLESPAVLIV
ncbi:MAG: Dihydrolipoyllysine-residue acetyltransferase component of pyruvate dehydrogenase complex [Chlamydiia bacterium]|nr:Dihydrolipoyllysine-residue acetyltransferase component of pyruvate dehydrogenase complex [Chlamydiia bacterium]MCH9615881.1 Dihydrolipoyllysine-residue acetyltransferase component of pyruvate dehydrogenase complex [Chlamydiia bacterium]MCH9628716.1 Dihydrolipoyllysine-residue acetyltransferase component of pyruvate dehydrogenase complex [Chlamydiia bacterium]